MNITYYVHTYNAIHGCHSLEELNNYVLEMYKNTNEYDVDDCIEMTESIVLWAKHCGCPGMDEYRMNGMVITTKGEDNAKRI